MLIKACYITNSGNLRTNNEDCLLLNDLLVGGISMDQPEYHMVEGDKFINMVADGMGGHQKGELASKAVLEVFKENYVMVDKEDDIGHLIGIAKKKLNDIVSEDCSALGMGTTVAGMSIKGNRAIVFNCGDSRVYRLNAGFLEKLTRDHSVVQGLVDSGVISENSMRSHPQKHIITSAVAGDLKDELPEIYIKEIPLRKGQIFLLCTDGVWEGMDIEEMEGCLKEGDLAASVGCTFKKSMDSGRDNLSVIVFRVENE